MKVFTKTCARDAKRVIYQMRAFRRMGIPQIVMLERSEHYKAPEIRAEDGGTTRVFFVNDYLPEASQIESPYLRQQYVKLAAPLVFGQNFIEVDSDMCPISRGAFDAAFTPEPDGRQRWYWLPEESAPNRLIAPIEEWAWSHRSLLAEMPTRGSFMLEQKGWPILFTAVRDFETALREEHGSMLRAFLRAEKERIKVSEYQLFGTWIYDNDTGRYAHTMSPQPEWCHHYTSAEPLEPWMEANLKRAAGEW